MLKETGIQIAITFNQIFPIIGVRHESFKIFFYNTSIKTLAAELYLSSHKKLGQASSKLISLWPEYIALQL